jgi:hypothetical protein
MTKIKFFPILVIIYLIFIIPAFGRNGVEIQYTPTKILNQQNEFPVELTISNFSGIPVREVQMWYRWSGESRFKMQLMDNEGFNYFAALNVGETNGHLLEYYFTIAYLDNRNESYPSDAPANRVFRTAVQTLRNYGDQIVIISPEQEEQLYSNDVVISASFGSLLSMIDIEKTKLYLNTWDVTPYLQKFGDFITFSPHTVPVGRHKIRLELYDNQGQLIASREWFFNSLSVRGGEAPSGQWAISGRFFAETRQENLGVNNLDNSYNQSGLQLRADYNNWDLGGRMYFSNQEKSNRQPVNRYSGFVRYNFMTDNYISLEGGDTYPKLNPMIMQNIFLRGFYGRLYMKIFNIDFATGTTNRAIDGSYNAADSSTSYGTYRRKITTVRPSFGSGEHFQLGFIYLKGKDDVNSINYGINPQENAAFGTDLFLGFDQNRIIVEGNVNASLYNRNIQGGSIDFDSLSNVFDNISDSDKEFYKLVNKFVTVNQYLILRPGLAYQGRLLLRYFKNNLSFIYEAVDEDYYSLGQPYLLRDNRGFHLVDNIALLQNQVFLTLGFRQYRNNLQDIKSNTTTNKNFYGNISYFPMQNLPELTIGYNNYSRNNDVPADSLESILNRPEDNQTSSINFSAGYRFILKSLKNRIGLDLINYRRDDIFKYAESTSDYLTINLRTQYAIPLQTLLEVILQQTETGKDDPDLGSKLNFTTFGVGGNYRFNNVFTEDQLSLQANLRFGSVTSKYNLITVEELKYNRNYFSFRINYTLPKYGSFSALTDILSYSGDRSYGDFIYTLRYDVNF